MAESPATLRAYTRLRSELHKGELPQATRERIGLAVAERRNDGYTLNQYARTARAAGLTLDEVARAREFTSIDEKEQALLTLLKATLAYDEPVPTYWSRRPARPAGPIRDHRGGRRDGARPAPEPVLGRGRAAARELRSRGAALGRLAV